MPTIFSEKFFARFEPQFRPYLDRLDIPASILTRPDVEISDTKYVELLETVARESNPNLGLEMACAVEPQDLGIIGHAIAAASTMGEALQVFSRYLYVFSQSNIFRLDLAAQQAVCTYAVTILQPDLVRQDAEFALGFVTKAVFALTRQKVHPRLVEFSHSRLPAARQHEQVFGCDVLFERSANRIHLDRKMLDYPLSSADEGLLTALRFYLDDRLISRSEADDLVVKVKHLISSSLTQGIPTIEGIADQIGLSKRTLQRKLAERNVVFSELIDATCKPIALDYVRNTEFRITDIALMLGYSDLSAFSRAFKRWTGVSPQQMRDN